MHGAFPTGKGNAASGSRIIVLVAQENFQQLIHSVCSAYFADTEAGTNLNAQSAIIAAFTTNPERCRKVDGILRANTSAFPTQNAVLFMESNGRACSPALGIVAKNAPERTSFKEDYGPYARPVLAAATFYVSYEGNGNQIVCSLQMIISEPALMTWIP